MAKKFGVTPIRSHKVPWIVLATGQTVRDKLLIWHFQRRIANSKVFYHSHMFLSRHYTMEISMQNAITAAIQIHVDVIIPLILDSFSLLQ